jgi:hypothetical protein
MVEVYRLLHLQQLLATPQGDVTVGQVWGGIWHVSQLSVQVLIDRINMNDSNSHGNCIIPASFVMSFIVDTILAAQHGRIKKGSTQPAHVCCIIDAVPACCLNMTTSLWGDQEWKVLTGQSQ